MVTARGRTRRDGDRLLAAMRSASLTYAEVGATAGPLPTGYTHGHHRHVVGQGQADFLVAAQGLRSWAGHRAARVIPYRETPVEVGETVLLVLTVAVAELRIACRIVSVIDEQHRFGFTYGTLPCHPEIGEERFLVEFDPVTEDVAFTIDVFWRSGHVLARLASPVAAVLQRRYTDRYLQGMADYVATHSPT